MTVTNAGQPLAVQPGATAQYAHGNLIGVTATATGSGGSLSLMPGGVSVGDMFAPVVYDGADDARIAPSILLDGPPAASAPVMPGTPAPPPTAAGAADEINELVIDDWTQQDDVAAPTDPMLPTAPAAPTETTGLSANPATPQPPVVPPPKKPAFEKVEDVIAAFNKNKAAADLLAEFVKADGKVESGAATTGAKIVFSLTGGAPKIVLSPERLIDGSDAVGALLFELVRWKNQKQQTDIVKMVKAGTLTPAQGAEEYEKITYDYMQKQQKLVQDAVKAGDWALTTDRLQTMLGKYKTFEEFLKWEKDSGHYGNMEKQLERLVPKK